MKITFLGTSSGTPTLTRNVSGTAIQLTGRKEWILVDCGEGTQQQILRTRLSLVKLSAILLTHLHGDHCYGLPGLLASAQLYGRTAPLLLVGPKETEPFVKSVMQYTEMHLDYPIEFIPVEEAAAFSCDAGLTVTPCPLSHRVDSFAYRFEESRVPRTLLTEKLEQQGIEAGSVWWRLQKGENVTLANGRVLQGDKYSKPGRKPRTVVIGGDNDRPELLEKVCRDADLLVHEATYTEPVLQRVGEAPQHSSAARVAEFAEEIGLERLILTHFSPRYLNRARNSRQLTVNDLRNEAAAIYQGDLWLARDFDQFELTVNGELKRESLKKR